MSLGASRPTDASMELGQAQSAAEPGRRSRRRSCCSVQRGLIAGAVLGVLVAVVGGILIPVGEAVIRRMVEKVGGCRVEGGGVSGAS